MGLCWDQGLGVVAEGLHSRTFMLGRCLLDSLSLCPLEVNLFRDRRGGTDGMGKWAVGGVGGLVEKKSGGVELKGRKEATANVLESELAGMVRFFLYSLHFHHPSLSLPPFLSMFFASPNNTLMQCLSQIHTHLPALTHLPRTWTPLLP